MKRIGIDLDGTVADYLTTVIPHVAELYGLVPNFDVPAYTIEEVFGITKEDRPPDMRQRLHVDRRIFLNLPRLEHDNNQLTSQLKNEVGDLKIYFVTARSPHPVIIQDTRDWVDRNTDVYDDVFHVGSLPKVDFCIPAGITTMIEDEAGNIVTLAEKGINVIVMNQPWNRHLIVEELPGKVVRVSDWKQAVSAAKEFLR